MLLLWCCWCCQGSWSNMIVKLSVMECCRYRDLMLPLSWSMDLYRESAGIGLCFPKLQHGSWLWPKSPKSELHQLFTKVKGGPDLGGTQISDPLCKRHYLQLSFVPSYNPVVLQFNSQILLRCLASCFPLSLYLSISLSLSLLPLMDLFAFFSCSLQSSSWLFWLRLQPFSSTSFFVFQAVSILSSPLSRLSSFLFRLRYSFQCLSFSRVVLSSAPIFFAAAKILSPFPVI